MSIIGICTDAKAAMHKYILTKADPHTYGHRQLKARDPVRSPIFKQLTARLVLRWVTTWESLVLYVLTFFPIKYIIADYHIVISPY